jgi:CubicO group peptidase (beta-lactamase class C family)
MIPDTMHTGLLLVSTLLAPAPQDAVPGWMSRTEEILRDYDRLDAPGMSIAVIKDGEVLVADGYGLAGLEHGVPNEPTTIFRIGSTSKQFTAACIALLEIEGELSVAQDVRDYVPELPDYGVPLRIYHLIHHTSGIRDYVNILVESGRSLEGVTPEQSLADIAAEKELRFTPGDRWEYSNSNYLLLGLIVARVSGQSLKNFAHERLFEPLGMRNTHFHDRHDHVVRKRAFGYSPGADGKFALDITTMDHVGDGGLFTTVKDLALWDANFYDPEVGGPEFLELMHTVGSLNNGSDLTYAFGLMINDDGGRRTVSHGGSWVGYRAEMLRFPDERLTVICLANRGDVNPVSICRQIAEAFLD